MPASRASAIQASSVARSRMQLGAAVDLCRRPHCWIAQRAERRRRADRLALRGGGGGAAGSALAKPGAVRRPRWPPLRRRQFPPATGSQPTSGPCTSVRVAPSRFAASTSAASVSVASATRRVSVVNSMALRKAISFGPFGGCSSKSSSPSVTGTSFFSVTSSREIRALSALAMMVSRRFSCLISPARASSVSRSPNSSSSCAAVFGPMPGMPGTLSTESPVIACRSIIFSGGTPHFSITSGMQIGWSFIGSYIEHRRADELHQVLVGGDDRRVGARLAGQPRIGRDQVVGLVAFHLDAGQVEGARRMRGSARIAGSGRPAAPSGSPCTRRRARCGTSSTNSRKSPRNGSA